MPFPAVTLLCREYYTWRGVVHLGHARQLASIRQSAATAFVQRRRHMHRLSSPVPPLVVGVARGFGARRLALSVPAHGFYGAQPLVLRGNDADRRELLTISAGGRNSGRTALNEGPDVFGPPDACFAEFYRLWCLSSGDPGVPQGPTDWNDA